VIVGGPGSASTIDRSSSEVIASNRRAARRRTWAACLRVAWSLSAVVRVNCIVGVPKGPRPPPRVERGPGAARGAEGDALGCNP